MQRDAADIWSKIGLVEEDRVGGVGGGLLPYINIHILSFKYNVTKEIHRLISPLF